tara:strand:- start:373 stop:855 length:483 start_codon:yes stop_codon:yes gene_type:complete
MDAGITYADVRNPKWHNSAQTMIDCEVDFTHLGEKGVYVPFMAVESGDYVHTHKIYAECVAGDYGTIAAYSAPADITGNEAQKYLRMERNRLLAETDFYGNSDVTMSAEMVTYRQALRDMPANNSNAVLQFKEPTGTVEQTVGMPYGYTVWVNVTWPTKP